MKLIKENHMKKKVEVETETTPRNPPLFPENLRTYLEAKGNPTPVIFVARSPLNPLSLGFRWVITIVP